MRKEGVSFQEEFNNFFKHKRFYHFTETDLYYIYNYYSTVKLSIIFMQTIQVLDKIRKFSKDIKYNFVLVRKSQDI